jgi:hypothetical protein
MPGLVPGIHVGTGLVRSRTQTLSSQAFALYS